MNEETVNSVLLLVDKLSEKLTVPANKLLEALALRGYFEIATALGLIAAIVCIVFALRCARKVMVCEGWVVCTFFGGFLCVVFGVIALHHLAKAFMWLRNPEGYALLELLRMLRI
jgi:hypothetical protein